MASNQGKLPGTSVRASIGRHRREFDKFAKHVRDTVGRGEAAVEIELDVARGLADELDRLERDDDHSGHTLALVFRTYHDLRAPLHARLGSGTTSTGLENLRAALADAVSHSSTT